MAVHARRRFRCAPPGAAHPPIVGLMLIASALAGCGYDQIHELEDRVRTSRTDVEALVQRRVEPIPNLLEIVARHDAVETEAIERVREARDQLLAELRDGDLRAVHGAHLHLSGLLQLLLGGVRRAPGLLADPGFQIVQSQLEESRVSMEAARRDYNLAVHEYNDYIRGFPQVMTARIVRAREIEPIGAWELSSGARPSE